MYKLLKSELLKLKWSKMWIVPILFVLTMIIIYIYDGDAAFIVSGKENVLGEAIGFISGVYDNGGSVEFGQIARASMSYTIFISIVILVFSVSFFSMEYSKRTIKLLIANGESRINIYLSKIIVISGFSLVLYYSLVLAMFSYISIREGFMPNGGEILALFKLITLNFLAMEVFIILSILTSMIIRNVGITSIIMLLFVFIGVIVYGNVWDQMSTQSFLKTMFLKTNPMYYWSTICAYNFNNNIIREVIMYFIASIITLIPASYLIIRKQELK
ncbi:MAG: ABC transporter permease subunit [Peptostreptococcaceae bacterium]